MKAWQRWMAALMVIGAAQVGLAETEGKAKAQPTTDAEIAAALADAIAAIEATFQDAGEQVERIALLIAQTTGGLPQRSSQILGDLSRRVEADNLPVVTAAAVMSSGTGSPAVFKTILDAQTGNAGRVDAVRKAAANPAAVLGTEVAARVQPVAVRPAVAAAPSSVPVEVAGRGAISAAPPVIIPTPPPPQPPGPPPRPPALVYRGQGI